MLRPGGDQGEDGQRPADLLLQLLVEQLNVQVELTKGDGRGVEVWSRG